MRRLLALLAIGLCLALAGCRSAGAMLPPAESAVETTAAETQPALPEEGEEIVGTELKFENEGKQRVAYTGIVSNVLYVTSPAQLPKTEAFAKYDDAFFQDHALILVTDTVGSGSTQVRIGRITVSGGIAYVTLSRELPGQVGTADMATWQLWAEVEKDLRLQWKVANPVYRRQEDNRVSK